MSAKWTFMVYVAGYNNLSSFAGKDLTEMRKVGSSEAVKVAVFVKRAEQQAAHHILVGKDGKNEERENLGADVDSGLAPDAARLHPLGEAEGARGALRADDLEPRLGLGPAGLRRALRAGEVGRRDAARARRAHPLPDRAQPLQADARGRAEQARPRLAGDRLRRRHRPLARHARAGQGAGQGAEGARPPARPARDGRLPDELPRGRLPVRRRRARGRVERGARARRRLALRQDPRRPALEPGHGRRLARARGGQALHRVLQEPQRPVAGDDVRGALRRARAVRRHPGRVLDGRCGGRSRTTTSTPPGCCAPTRAARASTAT